MNSPSKLTPSQFFEPLSLRVGLGIFATVQVLANERFYGSQNELLKNILMGGFVISLIFITVGAGQVVIRNEKLKLQTPEAKMRRYYLYFIGVTVSIILLLPIVGYLYGRL